MTDQMLVDPVELTDAELDLVTGGQIQFGNLVNVNVSDVNVAAPINVSAAVAALGATANPTATQPGRIFQAFNFQSPAPAGAGDYLPRLFKRIAELVVLATPTCRAGPLLNPARLSLRHGFH